MKFSWEDNLGLDPTRYARKVLKACGFKHPPICEKTVADYLGLKIKEYSLDGLPQDEELHEALKTACAWLERRSNGDSSIGLYRDTRTSGNAWACSMRAVISYSPGMKNLITYVANTTFIPMSTSESSRKLLGVGLSS